MTHYAPSSAQAPKLPFWRTIGRSYSVFFRNIGTAVRGSWLWLLVVGALAAEATYVQFDAFRVLLGSPRLPVTPLAFPLKVYLLTWSLDAIMILGGASCAVMWHRFLLLAEEPSLSGSNIATGFVWRYVWSAILIFLLVILLGAPFGASAAYIAMQAHGDPRDPLFGAAMIGLVIVWVCALLIAMRLVPLLPARAIGDNGVTFREMWKITKGNAWRLFWGCALTVIPPLALLQVLFGRGILSKLTPIPGQTFELSQAALNEIVAFQSTGAVFEIFGGLIMVGFLSYSYQYLSNSSKSPSPGEKV